MGRQGRVLTVSLCALLVVSAAACQTAIAGPLENVEESIQSQVDLQMGEATDAPPAAPVIEWAGDAPSEDSPADIPSTDPQEEGQ